MSESIAYLDHAATTPMRPEAIAAMLPFLTERFGNASGSHRVARAAKAALEEARETVAAALGAQPDEIVFTSGGTEADNLAITGALAAWAAAHQGRPTPVAAVCTDVEHHAVLHTVAAAGGLAVPVDQLAEALDHTTAVVSVMLVNNEVGTIADLETVADVVRDRAPQAVLHTDAVQAVSWLDVADRAAPADLLAVSAHKFGGPKGVGALVVRRGVPVHPVLHGGGQERGLRSGTANVAGAVGMAAALRATIEQRAATTARLSALRDRLADGVLAAVPDAVETVPRHQTVPGICHLRFPGVESESLLVLLDDAGVCASAGSACASGAIEPSHVLTALGLSDADALSSVRLSLGWTSTEADVDLALKVLPDAVARLRSTGAPS